MPQSQRTPRCSRYQGSRHGRNRVPPPTSTPLNCTDGSNGECKNPEAPRHHDRSYNTFPRQALAPRTGRAMPLPVPWPTGTWRAHSTRPLLAASALAARWCKWVRGRIYHQPWANISDGAGPRGVIATLAFRNVVRSPSWLPAQNNARPPVGGPYAPNRVSDGSLLLPVPGHARAGQARKTDRSR